VKDFPETSILGISTAPFLSRGLRTAALRSVELTTTQMTTRRQQYHTGSGRGTRRERRAGLRAPRDRGGAVIIVSEPSAEAARRVHTGRHTPERSTSSVTHNDTPKHEPTPDQRSHTKRSASAGLLGGLCGGAQFGSRSQSAAIVRMRSTDRPNLRIRAPRIAADTVSNSYGSEGLGRPEPTVHPL
jgi:hypothetical protein